MMNRLQTRAPARPNPARLYPALPNLILPAPTQRYGVKKDLSLVIKFDDLVRGELVLTAGNEQEFLKFVKSAKEWRKRLLYFEAENRRLQAIIKEREDSIICKDRQIKQARNIVTEVQNELRKSEDERDKLRKQLQCVKDLLADGSKPINKETLEKIRNFDIPGMLNQKPASSKKFQNAAAEESCESLLDASELSFEDSVDNFLSESRLKVPKPYKRRSSAPKRLSHSFGTAHFAKEKLIVQTTMNMSKNGAKAKSFIETHPVTMDLDELRKLRKKSRQSREILKDDRICYSPSAPPAEEMITTPPSHPIKRTFSNAGSVPSRSHFFVKKGFSLSSTCSACGNRIKFGKTAYKCKDCGALSHEHCRPNVPLPCVYLTNGKENGYDLAHFIPLGQKPMIPAILDICVKEVEQRGLQEPRIYTVSGNEIEAKQLMDKLLNRKAIRWSNYEIHTVASAIKKFLSDLKDPVVPNSSWPMFVEAASYPDPTFAQTELIQAIAELPEPNKDTLAFLMVHLQAVAQNCSINLMDVDNIATELGPSIVGCSSSNPDDLAEETNKQQLVMKALLSIAPDYWSGFLSPGNDSIIDHKQPMQLKSSLRYYMASESPDVASPRTGSPAERLTSKQLSKNLIKRQGNFISPML